MIMDNKTSLENTDHDSTDDKQELEDSLQILKVRTGLKVRTDIKAGNPGDIRNIWPHGKQ